MDQGNINGRQSGVLEDNAKILQYWHIVRERRWLVLASFLFTIVLVAIYLFRAVPIYSSKSRVQIDSETENALGIESLVMQLEQALVSIDSKLKDMNGA